MKEESQKARECFEKALNFLSPLYKKHEADPIVTSEFVKSDVFNLAYDLARLLQDAADLEIALKSHSSAIKYLLMLRDLLPKVHGSLEIPIDRDLILLMQMRCLESIAITYLNWSKFAEARTYTDRFISEGSAYTKTWPVQYKIIPMLIVAKRRLGEIAMKRKEYLEAGQHYSEAFKSIQPHVNYYKKN